MTRLFTLLFCLFFKTILTAQMGISITLHQPVSPVWHSIYALKKAPNGDIWAGYDNAKIAHHTTGANWSVDQIPGNVGTIRALEFGASGLPIYAATASGLSQNDGTTWTTSDISNSMLPDNSVRAVIRTSNGDIWLGTAAGLVRISGSTWSVFKAGGSLTSDNIGDIVADATNNALWLAAGRYVIKVTNLTAASPTFESTDLYTTVVWGTESYDLAIAADGTLYAAGTQGIVQKKGSNWTKMTQFSGLNCSGVGVDNNGVLWVAEAYFGLHRLAGTSLMHLKFGTTTNLPSDQTYQIIADGSNKKWVAGASGGIGELDDSGVVASSEPIFETEKLTVLPTAERGIFQLFLEKTAWKNGSIEVLNSAGRLEKTQVFNAENTTDGLRLDLSNQPTGIYFLSILNENQRFSAKIWKP